MKYENYPPVKSLIEVLTRNGNNVTIITKYTVEPNCENNSRLHVIKLYDNEKDSVIRKTYGYFHKLHFLRKLVESEMKNNDVLWTTTDNALRELGRTALKYKHIMQLMELVDDIPLFPVGNWPPYNISKFAQKAYKVVVPEFNRAYIQKIWWNLNALPIVLPNKPANLPALEDAPDNVLKFVKKLKDEKRKIVLYQGGFQPDRNLEKYAEVIDSLSDEYILYIMGKDNEERKSLCNRYKNIEYIPFIEPPYHLLITEQAYIGLLPYVPKKVYYNSIFNVVYCAPNKIFEYAAYGIPMIGSDLPGLRIPFERYNIGRIVCNESYEMIKENIKQIDEAYNELSRNCNAFYEDINLDEIINSILL